MTKKNLFDCQITDTEVELERGLNKTATLKVVKYLNFVHDGGNKKIEKILEKLDEKYKIDEEKARQEKMEKKIAKKMRAKEERKNSHESGEKLGIENRDKSREDKKQKSNSFNKSENDSQNNRKKIKTNYPGRKGNNTSLYGRNNEFKRNKVVKGRDIVGSAKQQKTYANNRINTKDGRTLAKQHKNEKYSVSKKMTNVKMKHATAKKTGRSAPHGDRHKHVSKGRLAKNNKY